MNAPSVTPPSDELYDKAVAVVTETRRASISTVQRYLMIGYNRASRLMEMMELRGVVSASMRDGSRVLLDDQSRKTAPTAALSAMSAMSAMSAIDALKPSPQLLCKLGSIIVHADELLSPKGHEFDHDAMHSLLRDPDINAWIAAMRSMALLPEKR